jgi:inner membrane protein involved in colicin E2 resistance
VLLLPLLLLLLPLLLLLLPLLLLLLPLLLLLLPLLEPGKTQTVVLHDVPIQSKNQQQNCTPSVAVASHTSCMIQQHAFEIAAAAAAAGVPAAKRSQAATLMAKLRE